MNLYFSNTSDQDPTNANNWWDGTGGTGANGYTPTGSDDCFIDASQTCNDSNFTYGSLTVNGTLTTNTSGKVVVTNNANIGDNYGTVTTNNGTIGSNQSGATVVINSAVISSRISGGTTTTEYEAVDIPSGYTVVNLYAGITNNYGIIGTLVGVTVENNHGTITTVNSTSTVSYNFSSIVTNNGQVSRNYSGGTITTNSATGTVYDNMWGAIITTNNGTLRIGTVTGGTGNIRANATTNLANHTAGTNVTLPSGNTTWW